MNFMADESCAGPVIRALRDAGHEVVAIAEVARGATDEQVLERALEEKRVLITEDLDFGRLVYFDAHPKSVATSCPKRRMVVHPPRTFERIATASCPLGLRLADLSGCRNCAVEA